MAIALKSVDDLQEHLLGVFERSDHHAGEVNEVLLAIAGGILWRKNPGDHVRVNEKEGAGGNVIWFRIGLQRYALLYNHRARRIELMFGGRRGHLLHTFTNATPLAEVSRVFSTLGMSDEEAEAYLAERAEIKARFPKGHKGRHKQASAEAAHPPSAQPVEPPAPAGGEPALATEGKPARPARTAKVASAPGEGATKTRRSAKLQVQAPDLATVLHPPEAIQLPLVTEGEPAPKTPAAPRKRRSPVKARAEQLADVVAADAAAAPAAPSAAAKPRSKPRSKAAPASSLQPA